jgi:hypothetical protein
MVMSNLVIILRVFYSIGAMLRSFSKPVCLPGGINEDPAAWLDGARQPPKYGNNVSSTNLKIQPTLKFCD